MYRVMLYASDGFESSMITTWVYSLPAMFTLVHSCDEFTEPQKMMGSNTRIGLNALCSMIAKMPWLDVAEDSIDYM